MIFGYLQVGQILKVTDAYKCLPWLEYHPHTNERYRKAKNNTIYTARETLSFNSK
ncbi:MAG: hypothetical protein IPH84_18565 [Bacteroidales bacterium]|nr:hypothetical protein [Bacteroidales bacterium]